jgi:2-amino-4-hydroxy-6-hydroxymethyldihydropteridine diphosphokinase
MAIQRTTKAFLGLGSNESPETKLPRAVAALRELGPIVAVSRVYESDAVPPGSGPPYLNAAVCIATVLSPSVLKRTLRDVERRLGRDRESDAVAIDIDLCLFGDAIIHGQGLDIPHPELRSQVQVIVPMAECEPGFRHPETKETLKDMSARVRLVDRRSLVARPDVVLSASES